MAARDIANFLNAVLETGGIKPSDVQQVRVPTSTTVFARCPKARSMGPGLPRTGTNEEANAMEPVRMLNLPNPMHRIGFLAATAVRWSRRRHRPGCAAIPMGSRCLAHCRISKLSDRAVGALTKLGGTISPSCRRSIRCSNNGPRRTRRSLISRSPTTRRGEVYKEVGFGR